MSGLKTKGQKRARRHKRKTTLKKNGRERTDQLRRLNKAERVDNARLSQENHDLKIDALEAIMRTAQQQERSDALEVINAEMYALASKQIGIELSDKERIKEIENLLFRWMDSDEVKALVEETVDRNWSHKLSTAIALISDIHEEFDLEGMTEEIEAFLNGDDK